jgi:hypothetical protein
VPPASLIKCLTGRFAGIGEEDNITISPNEGLWEINDLAYGTEMHSFVSCSDVTQDRMRALTSKRMRYLSDKLLADLEAPTKVFFLKAGWEHVTPAEIEALSRGIRSYGTGELLCVCPVSSMHPEGEIVAAAPGLFVGYMDFSSHLDQAERLESWETLCQTMLRLSKLPRPT